MRKLFSCLLTSTLLCSATVFAAPVYVHVSDMSKIKYQVVSDKGGRVFFRNLNEFNSSVTGCCYAFYLDITTDYGKSAWSTMLMKMASQKNLYLYVSESNPPTSGAPAEVTHIGNW
ncbi:hypothetical protein [Vibrio coralliilyticus]|uniref:hypothetical protein n=2 Tax=Vibrionaceae TaxID=641 RepID=UPI0015604DCD|nr:hypothetical protein [Vibrio coralliilyticus]NRF28945.1 hypothetical protein [Vibrio coralliilyticus]NRF50804.1 hypothetical protein [Vibrio coralliilyticus]